MCSSVYWLSVLSVLTVFMDGIGLRFISKELCLVYLFEHCADSAAFSRIFVPSKSHKGGKALLILSTKEAKHSTPNAPPIRALSTGNKHLHI